MLEAELALRADRRVPAAGVEYICVQGVEGLRDAGVLSGVRAMVARVQTTHNANAHLDAVLSAALAPGICI